VFVVNVFQEIFLDIWHCCLVLAVLFCMCGFRAVGLHGDSCDAHYQSVHGNAKPFSCLQSFSMKRMLAWIMSLLDILLAAIEVLF
jgi:hypothetical protein